MNKDNAQIVTNVVMEVTPQIGKMVQKVAFRNGIVWHDGSKELLDTNNFKYLYIMDCSTMWYLSRELDESDIRVNPLHYILSRGTRYELPEEGKEYEFSNDNKEWCLAIFEDYAHSEIYQFITKQDKYRYWRNVKKEFTLKGFLENNGVKWEDFLDNCKIENQRWPSLSSYTDNIDEIKCKDAMSWIYKAFNFENSNIPNIRKIADKWESLVCDSSITPKWE